MSKRPTRTPDELMQEWGYPEIPAFTMMPVPLRERTAAMDDRLRAYDKLSAACERFTMLESGARYSREATDIILDISSAIKSIVDSSGKAGAA